MQKTIILSSPNFDQRAVGIPLAFVVLHYTNMVSGEAARDWLCQAASKVSAHYLIEEDGRIFQMVDEKNRAWHAGLSSWQGRSDLNSSSIGIELVNPGHLNGYQPFPKAQITSLINLLKDIIQRNKMNAKTCLLAHADIAPARKQDPGEYFPWRDLANDGLGLVADPDPSDYGFADDREVQNLLRAIGYECPDSGSYDQPTRWALLAFQRHYHPENLTGTPEKETIARLRTLKRLMAAST